MRKGIIMAIFSALLLSLSSCKKDESIVGTSWVNYYDSSRTEGMGLRFETESLAVLTDWEYHQHYESEDILVNYTYTAPNGFLYQNNGSALKFSISKENRLIIGEGTDAVIFERFSGNGNYYK